MIRIFCDICRKELKRNMVEDKLVVEQGDFKAEVIISYEGVFDEGDLCLDCLMKMLNTKPKRKYVRKVAEQVSAPPVEESIASTGYSLKGNFPSEPMDNALPVVETKQKQKKKDKLVDMTITATDTVTIKVPYPGGPDEHEVTIGEAKGKGLILKLAVERALAQFDLLQGEFPAFCTENDRKLLSGILGI